MENQHNDMWAVIELMGHDVTAGIIKQSDIGGLLRVDVPVDEGYRTEYLGEGSIFRIRIVSEEIARVYDRPEKGVIAYDEPIVSRSQYEDALQNARNEISGLNHQIRTLSDRLTRVNSLPAPEPEEDQNEVPFD